MFQYDRTAPPPRHGMKAFFNRLRGGLKPCIPHVDVVARQQHQERKERPCGNATGHRAFDRLDRPAARNTI